MRIPEFRDRQLRGLPRKYGVYALCDLDQTPIYVGQSFGGRDDHIASRVRRHLTSARSDIIANRLVDIWEVAFVRAWVCDQRDRDHTNAVEAFLFQRFDRRSRLMNGRVLADPVHAVEVPEPQVVQVLPDEVIAQRRAPEFRLPRQVAHIAQMIDWMLEVAGGGAAKAKSRMILRALSAHVARLNKYHAELQEGALS